MIYELVIKELARKKKSWYWLHKQTGLTMVTVLKIRDGKNVNVSTIDKCLEALESGD